MKIKYLLQMLIENITDRKCSKCKHCVDGISCDNLKRYEECCSKIYPVGFEKKEVRENDR